MERPRVPHYVVVLARKLRRRQTTAEEVLWDCLRDRRLAGSKFRRQHPLGRYIADFYCHETRLVIELQGNIHQNPTQIEYDAIRQNILEEAGIQLLIFHNDEVFQSLERVITQILDSLTPGPSPPGRGVTEPRARSG